MLKGITKIRVVTAGFLLFVSPYAFGSGFVDAVNGVASGGTTVTSTPTTDPTAAFQTSLLGNTAQGNASLGQILAELKAFVLGYSQSSQQAYQNVPNWGTCPGSDAFSNPYDYCDMKVAQSDFATISTAYAASQSGQVGQAGSVNGMVVAQSLQSLLGTQQPGQNNYIYSRLQSNLPSFNVMLDSDVYSQADLATVQSFVNNISGALQPLQKVPTILTQPADADIPKLNNLLDQRTDSTVNTYVDTLTKFLSASTVNLGVIYEAYAMRLPQGSNNKSMMQILSSGITQRMKDPTWSDNLKKASSYALQQEQLYIDAQQTYLLLQVYKQLERLTVLNAVSGMQLGQTQKQQLDATADAVKNALECDVHNSCSSTTTP